MPHSGLPYRTGATGSDRPREASGVFLVMHRPVRDPSTPAPLQRVDIEGFVRGDPELHVRSGFAGPELQLGGLIPDRSALDLGVRIAPCRAQRRPHAVFPNAVAPQFHSGRDPFISNVIEPRPE